MCIVVGVSMQYILTNTIPFLTGRAVPVATRSCLVAADVLVVVLTWVKTFQTYKDSTVYGIRAPLLVLFFRDGE